MYIPGSGKYPTIPALCKEWVGLPAPPVGRDNLLQYMMFHQVGLHKHWMEKLWVEKEARFLRSALERLVGIRAGRSCRRCLCPQRSYNQLVVLDKERGVLLLPAGTWWELG